MKIRCLGKQSDIDDSYVLTTKASVPLVISERYGVSSTPRKNSRIYINSGVTVVP